MKFFVIALGLAMAAIGGQAVWTGYDIVEIERGWSAVIAGATVFAGGLITIAIGFLMWRVDALRKAVLSLRRDDVPLPKAVEIPLGAVKVAAPLPTLGPDLSEPVSAELAPVVEPVPETAEIAPPPAVPKLVVTAPVVPPPAVLPASFLARSNVAPLPTRAERINRTGPTVVAANDSLESERESGAPSQSPLPAPEVALSAPGASSQSVELAPRGPIILPRRLDRVLMPKRRSNGAAREASAQDEAAPEPTVSTVPPRAPPISRGIWPEGPSVIGARRPVAKPTLRPLEAPPRQVEETASTAPQVDVHDWLERALAGVDTAEQQSVAPPVVGDRPDIVETTPALAAQSAAPQPDAIEPATPAEPTPEASAAAEAAVTPVARYEAHGTAYVMFNDGSIEAESNNGHYRFASIEELKQFIESKQD